MDVSGLNAAAQAAAQLGISRATSNYGIGAQAAAPAQTVPLLRTHQAVSTRRALGNSSGYPWPYSLPALTPPDFYGSGARSNSRRRRDASREARRPGPRTGGESA